MKKIIIILFISVFYISESYAQRNYAQELINLLVEGRCFEAKEFFNQHSDMLPHDNRAFELLYKLNMARFFNKSDSIAIYMEEILANNDYQLTILGKTTGEYFRILLNLYSFNQKFNEAIELCDKMTDYFKRNPFDFDSDLIQKELKLIEKEKALLKERAINEPLFKIERSYSEDNKIKRYEDDLIRFDSKYNGVQIETLFDTGSDHNFFISKSLADEIGVREIKRSPEDIKVNINGVEEKAYEGMIDSIEIKTIKFYNVPVLVYLGNLKQYMPDSLAGEAKANAERAYKERQIIMGLRIINLIGKIEIDWDNNTISFPETGESENDNSVYKNIFMLDNKLYMHMDLNELSFSGCLNTGYNDFINLSRSFYEKNKSSFIDKESIVKELSNSLDGILGIVLLKNLKPKAIIDFQNMVIRPE